MSLDYALIQKGGAELCCEITQAGHGLTLGQAVYNNAGTWTATSGNATNAEVSHIVCKVTDAATFEIQAFGPLEWTGHGLTVDEYYHLDPATGALSPVLPSGDGEWVNTMYYVIDSDKVQVMAGTRPYLVEVEVPLKPYSAELACEESQAGHGFVVGDQIYPSAAGWVLADATDIDKDNLATVTAVVDAGTFCFQSNGYALISHGFALYNYFWVDPANPGKPTTVRPTTLTGNSGDYQMPAFYTVAADKILVMSDRRSNQIP